MFGVGPEDARVILIGEGPGRHEDEQGEPFVGAAGKLLNRILRDAEISREAVYITNIVKCRPPGNRDPEYDEIRACHDWLGAQIQTIDPQAIVTMGRFATSRVSGAWGSRGAFLDDDGLAYHHIPVIPVFHPSYLLRQLRGPKGAAKQLYLDTVQRFRRAAKLAG